MHARMVAVPSIHGSQGASVSLAEVPPGAGSWSLIDTGLEVAIILVDSCVCVRLEVVGLE